MRPWPRSSERLLTVSARMLAGASVVTAIGVGLALRMSWHQAGQNYGPEGPVDSDVPLDDRLSMVMLETSYRQIGVQLLLAAALLGAAVVALHRHPSWAKVRRVRWELLASGFVTLALVVGLLLANLYVLTPSDEAAGGVTDYLGPQPVTELVLGNLPTLVASLVTLTAVALWWMRLKPVGDGTEDDPVGEGVDQAVEETGETAGADRAAAMQRESVERTPVERTPDSAPAPRDSADNLGSGSALGYPQDWSPEDFRRPS